MRGLIVANPQAAAGSVGRRWHEHERAVHACFGVFTTQFTSEPGHATRIVRNALADGVERIVAVGGDGTLNEVVNGFVDARGAVAPAELGLFPVGTGGDFARSIGMRDVAPAEVAGQIVVRDVDVGMVASIAADGSSLKRYFVNVASLGSSALIVDKVNATGKLLGGKASFYVGTLKGMAAHKNQLVRLRVDDQFEEEMLVNTVALANGRFFGGGMKIAPSARLDDGKLEVVVMGDIGLGFFVRHSGKIYAGTHTQLPEIRVLSGSRITVAPVGRGETLVECDGERVGRAPVAFTVLPASLKLLAPWARAEA